MKYRGERTIDYRFRFLRRTVTFMITQMAKHLFTYRIIRHVKFTYYFILCPRQTYWACVCMCVRTRVSFMILSCIIIILL